MRAHPGDRIELFDGTGGAEYEISEIAKRSVLLRRLGEFPANDLRDVRISLFAALPNRYEKLEYAIQKGVEVGIGKFVFFPSERSQKLAITPGKIQRFEAIAREALEQCGGFRMPELEFLAKWPELPSGIPTAFLHTADGAESLGQFADGIARKGVSGSANGDSDPVSVALLVGPEGGFSDSELERAKVAGAVPVRAGRRIMRTETAGVAVAFALGRMLEW